MISFDEKLKHRIYCFLSFLYILSLFFHKYAIIEKYSFIKSSEFIFVILLIVYLALDTKKIIKNFDKFDLVFFSWPILNIFQFFFYQNNLIGVISSSYVFFLYLIFKNLFFDLGKKKIIKYLIISLILISLITIIGWSLAQFKIDLSLTEYKVGWPIYIFDRYRSTGFMPTPNMLFFFLSFGFLIIQNFEFKHKKITLILIFFAILLTFSKSLMFFVPLMLIPYIIMSKNRYFIKVYLFGFLVIIFLFNILTNFIVAPKKVNIFTQNDHSHYRDKNRDHIYENKFFTIYQSNYAQIKSKSFKIIQKNFFTGIGYDQFKKLNIDDHEFIFGYKPHSSIFGLVVDNGILSILIFSYLIYYCFKLNFLNKNYFFLSLVIFLILESFNTDIHYFKIIWIFFPLLLYENEIKNEFSQSS